MMLSVSHVYMIVITLLTTGCAGRVKSTLSSLPVGVMASSFLADTMLKSLGFYLNNVTSSTLVVHRDGTHRTVAVYNQR